MIKNGVTEDFLTDINNDGFANFRSIIKTPAKENSSKSQMLTDLNPDEKMTDVIYV